MRLSRFFIMIPILLLSASCSEDGGPTDTGDDPAVLQGKVVSSSNPDEALGDSIVSYEWDLDDDGDYDDASSATPAISGPSGIIVGFGESKKYSIAMNIVTFFSKNPLPVFHKLNLKQAAAMVTNAGFEVLHEEILKDKKDRMPILYITAKKYNHKIGRTGILQSKRLTSML